MVEFASSCRKCMLMAPMVLLVAGVAFLGCGSKDGAERFHISGQVTFSGEPVPAGQIIFEPDTSRQNSGPQGFAEIKNGQYNTRETGKGHVGGPHMVRIEGFDGDVVDPEYFPHGTPIFSAYRIEADLPQESSTQDFEVPEDAAP